MQITNSFDLKKKVVWDYNSISNCAKVNNLNAQRLFDVLNARQRHTDTENFLIKLYSLPDNFFSVNFGKPIPILLKAKITPPKRNYNRTINQKITSLEELKQTIIEKNKSISFFAEKNNLKKSILIDILNARQRHTDTENFLIKFYSLPDDFFISPELFETPEQNIDFTKINSEEKIFYLKKMIRHKYNSQSAFARSIGFNVSTLNKFLNRGSTGTGKSKEIENLLKKEFSLPDFFF